MSHPKSVMRHVIVVSAVVRSGLRAAIELSVIGKESGKVEPRVLCA